MRVVIQRVLSASVTIGGTVKSSIGPGLLILLGVGHEDSREDVDFLVRKIAALRIFDDENGVMNRSVIDTGGSILAVSQFTLYGDARGGRRPSYIRAAKPDEANALYERLVAAWRAKGIHVETGRFRTDMKVSLVNDGPVTILIDSEKAF